MKKFLALLTLSVFLVSCQNAVPKEETLENIPSTDYAPPIEELLSSTSESNREDVSLSSSSELKDTTSYGFDYNAESAIDQDLSTAWCKASDDESPEWSIDFAETLLAGTMGIQTGFARSEEIFAQNNRVKTLEVYFDEELVDTFELEDSYDMQFLELQSDWPLNEISLKITDVYPGSQYNDTCISEIDFWSDYVLEQNASAALDYYQNYKEDDAIRPVSATVSILPADSLTSCGSFNSNAYVLKNGMYESVEDNEWGYKNVFWINNGPYDLTDRSFNAGDHVALSARLSGSVIEEDIFTVRWSEGRLVNMDDIPEREWSLYDESKIAAETCSDGTLYLSMEQPDSDAVGPFSLYSVEVLFEGRSLGSTSFGFVQ